MPVKFVAGLGLLFLLTGCATFPVNSRELQVSVEPVEINPGSVVRLEVRAPAGTREVTGQLDLPGTPVVKLKREEEGQRWTFTTQIPLHAVWEPGSYRVRVQAIGPENQAWVSETWVQAR